MLFYTDQNIALFNQARGNFPNKVYLPLNTGRTAAPQIPNYGRFVDQIPSESIDLASWINESAKITRIFPYMKVTAVSGAYSVLSTDVAIISTGTHTITLPSAPLNKGRWFIIKSVSGTATIAAVAGTVEDTSIAATEFVTYLSDGTNWLKIS